MLLSPFAFDPGGDSSPLVINKENFSTCRDAVGLLPTPVPLCSGSGGDDISRETLPACKQICPTHMTERRGLVLTEQLLTAHFEGNVAACEDLSFILTPVLPRYGSHGDDLSREALLPACKQVGRTHVTGCHELVVVVKQVAQPAGPAVAREVGSIPAQTPGLKLVRCCSCGDDTSREFILPACKKVLSDPHVHDIASQG